MLPFLGLTQWEDMGSFAVFGGGTANRISFDMSGQPRDRNANPKRKTQIFKMVLGTFARLGAPGYGSIDLGVDGNGSFIIDNYRQRLHWDGHPAQTDDAGTVNASGGTLRTPTHV